MIKKNIILISVVILALSSYSTSVSAQTATEAPCSVGVMPVPNKDGYNEKCEYAPIRSTNFYDSCYQIYLQRKADWVRQCLRYWDEQKAKEAAQVTPIPSPAAQNTNEVEELKKKISELESKINTLQNQQTTNDNSGSTPRVGRNDQFIIVQPIITVTVTPTPTETPTTTPQATKEAEIKPAVLPTGKPALIQKLTSSLSTFFSSVFGFFKRK